MNVSTRQELNTIIEDLTHSGEPFLNQDTLRKLKRLCKSSNLNLRAAYEMTMTHLSKEHAEIRLSAFQLIDDLFTRSHLFRELLISDFKLFTKLVTGIDADDPLPPPVDVSVQLKEKSLLAIRNWNEKFGDGYPKLRLGYNYLKFNKKVNFEELVAQSEVAQRYQQQREDRRKVMLEQRIREIKQEIADLQPDILDCLTQTESCFNLLLPRFDLPDLYCSTSNTDQLTTERKQKCSAIPSTVSSTEGCFNKKRSSSCSSLTSVSSDECKTIGNLSAEDDSVPDKTILAAIYGTTTDNTASKDRKKMSMCTSKGKGKLTTESIDDRDIHIREEENDGSSDSESEVEWEDVLPVAELKDSAGEYLELQQHGFASHNFSIPVEVSSQFEIVEDEHNSNILATLKENQQMLTCSFLPTIMKWIEWLTKGEEEEQLRNAIDLKQKVKMTLEKFSRLKLQYKDLTQVSNDPCQEVVQQKKNICKSHAEWTFGFGSHNTLSADMECDPTTPEAQLSQLKLKTARSRSSETNSVMTSTSKSVLHPTAPVVPFDMDLFHWEDPAELQLISTAQVGSFHRFWVEEREVNITEDQKRRLNCRTINYTGEFEPVQRACRARLPSGRLCPRRDRQKCPFHGLIVPRDDSGRPIDMHISDQEIVQHAKKSAPVHEKLGTPTGLNVKKRLNSDRRKFPRLTDLRRSKDTPRKRLAQKVLSNHSLKKIAQQVDCSSRKFQDKFGYSFNYALKS